MRIAFVRGIVFAASALAGTVTGAQVTTADVAASGYRVVRGNGDTLNAGVVRANGVAYLPSTVFGDGGRYKVTWMGDAYGLTQNRAFRLGPARYLQQQLDSALALRPVARRAVTGDSLRSLANFPGGVAGTRPMVGATIPFLLLNAGGRALDVVMFQRHTTGDAADSLHANSRLLGTRGDTVRVQVPPDMWVPGDTLYVVERGAVTLQLTLGCVTGGAPPRTTCNPLALGTRGATGYLPYDAGYESVWTVRSSR